MISSKRDPKKLALLISFPWGGGGGFNALEQKAFLSQFPLVWEKPQQDWSSLIKVQCISLFSGVSVV